MELRTTRTSMACKGSELYGLGSSGHPSVALCRETRTVGGLATRAEVPPIRIALSLVPGAPHLW
jgi:hypothetical protein